MDTRQGLLHQPAHLCAHGAAVDVLNCKIAEYTQAVVQDRPSFHISIATDMRATLEAKGGIPECCQHDHFNLTHPDTNWRSMIEHSEKIGLGTSHYELAEVR